jgi:hypothetical protein
MFEPSRHLVYVRAKSRTLFVRQAESRTLPYLFMFERSREPCATLLPVYVRAESRTLTPCLCSSLPETLFMFEQSREPCPTCLCSSEVENPALLYTMFTFERSREPCPTCSCSSGVENLPALLVYVRAKSRTFFIRQAESRTPFRIVHQNSIFES